MTVPKLVTVSFSGLERRKGCKTNEIGAEGSLFPNMMMGQNETKFQLGSLSFGDIYLDGCLFLPLF